jgi:hypothetical protein
MLRRGTVEMELKALRHCFCLMRRQSLAQMEEFVRQPCRRRGSAPGGVEQEERQRNGTNYAAEAKGPANHRRALWLRIMTCVE